jgi:hypothetical protein
MFYFNEINRLQALEDEENAANKDAQDLRAIQNRENNRFELFRNKPTFR